MNHFSRVFVIGAAFASFGVCLPLQAQPNSVGVFFGATWDTKLSQYMDDYMKSYSGERLAYGEPKTARFGTGIQKQLRSIKQQACHLSFCKAWQEKANEWILEARQGTPVAPKDQYRVDIFGFSRGSIFSTGLAYLLKQEGCTCQVKTLDKTRGERIQKVTQKNVKVTFLGLLDPVNHASSVPSKWTNQIPSNVLAGVHIHRDKRFRPIEGVIMPIHRYNDQKYLPTMDRYRVDLNHGLFVKKGRNFVREDAPTYIEMGKKSGKTWKWQNRSKFWKQELGDLWVKQILIKSPAAKRARLPFHHRSRALPKIVILR